MNEKLKLRIQNLISTAPVMLFMKGDKYVPQCGFSARVLDLLNDLEAQFTTFDILADDEIRQGLKEYSDWPTFPQLYVNGELIGGCDIIVEMHESGELKDLINKIK